MSSELRNSIMHTLEDMQEDLIHRVAESLFSAIPVVGISELDTEKVKHHHRNMVITAQRFHEIVQAGATIDWSLVSSEFAWADRKLGTMGITHDHHQRLINTYFSEALKLHAWTEEEREVMEHIASELRQAADEGYKSAATT